MRAGQGRAKPAGSQTEASGPPKVLRCNDLQTVHADLCRSAEAVLGRRQQGRALHSAHHDHGPAHCLMTQRSRIGGRHVDVRLSGDQLDTLWTRSIASMSHSMVGTSTSPCMPQLAERNAYWTEVQQVTINTD